MSTNPFDDDPLPPSPHPIVGRSTNPFGNEDDEDIVAPPQRVDGGRAPDALSSAVAAPPPMPLNSGSVSRSAFLGSGSGDDAFESSSTGEAGTRTGNESSWQDLGDLPYRRVRLYSGVRWGRRRKEKGSKFTTQQPAHHGTAASQQAQADVEQDPSSGEEQFGLSWYPKSYVETVRSHQDAVLGSVPGDRTELARLLSTTTTTLVAGCPNGGPVAAVTVPLSTHGGGGGASSGFGSRSTIRIMNNAGVLLSSIAFPPRDLALPMNHPSSNSRLPLHVTPGDILTIGFTSRCVFIIVLRDSLTLCYDLLGSPVLPPFYSLGNAKGGSPGRVKGSGNLPNGMDLLEARVFEGGVAVLGVDMNASVVELLDEFDDPSYADGADVSARKVIPLAPAQQRADQPSFAGEQPVSKAAASPFLLAPPPHYALVTPLPTGMFARSKHLTFQCIAVLPRQYAPSGRPELFLSTSDGSVVVSELNPSTSPDNGFTDVDCRSRIGGSGMGPPAPIVSMAFAPNGRFLACFTSDSILTVVSTNFESKVLEFDARSGSPSPPRSMGWCGEDSVVLHWRELGVLMVGPYGDWLRFPCGEDGTGHGNTGSGTEAHLVPEIDCCRVVTPSSVEILQRVPPGTADLLRIGSIEPGALLLDASDAFDSGTPNADEAAKSITRREGLMDEAVLGCVEAAMGEFDVMVQKRMLRAASYGLHFACKDENARNKLPGRPIPEARAFVDASRKLRTLNVLRRPGTGLAMTSLQYDSVAPRGVVARLVATGRASLAASIAEYLKLGRRVGDYARAMKTAAFVSLSASTLQKGSSMTDTQIAEEAIRIIRGEEKGSAELPASTAPLSSGMYTSVALAAHRVGRKGVADLLIMLEQSPADKVQALLAIGSYPDAAAVACRARDPDLIHMTMFAYEQGLSSNEEGKSLYFSGVINKFPIEAVNIFTAFYSRLGDLRGGDARPAVNILLRRQRHAEAGLKMARRALANRSTTTSGEEREKEKVASLQEASSIFDLGGKDCAFQKACTDEQIALAADQEQLRRSYGSAEVAPPSSSLTSTIMSILKYGAVDPRSVGRLQADADRIAKKYRVPEKRTWHVKVRALSESGQWAHLRNLADSRKPPIGLKPFALAAIRKGQGRGEVMHYLDRMTDKSDGEDRYDLCCEAGIWKRAVEEAVRLGDGRKVAHVRSVC
eukprot:CAMPEP_0172567060 /NCGR_PEP_ID=MMETSP1067-20121228/114430_1 /TAXON_ID=265564 ORGANISM="Thalassiosira punctigera, Strain Tpunct2005C2" /NCGR_SAMPLE_ID=MMETSP1067 /ASSEMBLY_ACC=CAM_ASM_000444 /LENGTH=1182 /DNA_ID=CAMNT_0013358321 /DNA_START=76 /DNA_END=3621 /DNA_ORIENTATION=-